jgi:hypothetical protein
MRGTGFTHPRSNVVSTENISTITAETEHFRRWPQEVAKISGLTRLFVQSLIDLWEVEKGHPLRGGLFRFER